MTKSITNALIGILIKAVKLDIDKAAPIDEWQKDDRRQITITNLMQMNSGLKWWEYPYAPSDFTNMLFKAKSMSAYGLKAPLKDKPGTIFNYSSESPNILAYIIRRTVGDSNYYRSPYKELFYKIGMFNTILEVDPGGTFVGST